MHYEHEDQDAQNEDIGIFEKTPYFKLQLNKFKSVSCRLPITEMFLNRAPKAIQSSLQKPEDYFSELDENLDFNDFSDKVIGDRKRILYYLR